MVDDQTHTPQARLFQIDVLDIVLKGFLPRCSIYNKYVVEYRCTTMLGESKLEIGNTEHPAEYRIQISMEVAWVIVLTFWFHANDEQADRPIRFCGLVHKVTIKVIYGVAEVNTDSPALEERWAKLAAD